MTKDTYCRLYEITDKTETYIALKRHLRKAIALCVRIRMANGEATISRFRINNRVREGFILIKTDLSITRLKRLLLDHFDNYEAIELKEGRNCVITNAVGCRRELHLEDLIATLKEHRRAIGA